MPNRILREGILTSERVNELTPPAEVFYRRLMSVVDDFGRYYAKHSLLRAGLFPLKLDYVRDADIASWIGCAREAGLIVVYSVEGKDYLEIVDFRQQVRAKESRFPAPPAGVVPVIGSRDASDVQAPSGRIADDKQASSTCVADAQQMRTKTYPYSESESGTAPPSSRGARLSLAAAPDEWVQFCRKERKDLDPTALFAQFRDYWIAQPGPKGVKADWFATWRNWVRRDNGASSRRPSSALEPGRIPI